MFQQNLKLFQEYVEKTTLEFFKALKLPQTASDPTSQILLENLQAYLSNPKKYKEPKTKLPFEEALNRFNHAKEVPQTSSRLCGAILRKNDRAYKCLQCMTEDNSIVCLNCFDLEKHKGHHFELIHVGGGCCDCGDSEKWRAEGFCSNHCEHDHIEISLDQLMLKRFLEQQHFAFSIVLYLYSEFIKLKKRLAFDPIEADQQKQKRSIAVQGSVRFHLEAFSAPYISQLIEFNKVGKYAQSMTQILFDSRPDLTKLCQLPSNGETFFQSLFGLQEFPKTAETICELFIVLFSMGNFREKLTAEFIRRYVSLPDFPSSPYSHLCSQLLTSYLCISRLVESKQIPPLAVRPLTNPQNIEESAQIYVRYYYDINYLSKLYGDAAIKYFTYHAQQQKMQELCHYGINFDPFSQAISYYGLEEIFLNRMVSVIHVIQRDPSHFIQRATLRQIYRSIMDNPKKTNNLYRPHQRFFALLTFHYLQGDLSRLQDEMKMAQYLQIIGVQNLNKQLEVLIQRACTVLSFAASVLGDQENLNNQNYTFYSFYFNKSRNLFSLDAILLKIAITLARLHKIDFSQMIKHGDKLNRTIQKMEDYSSSTGLPAELEVTTKNVGFTLQQKNVNHFVTYMSLLHEAVVSDLPILNIKCFFKPSRQEVNRYKLRQLPYQDAAFHHYSNILKSCGVNKISTKDFKQICDQFFKEEEVFRIFVKKHLDKNDHLKLDSDKSKGSPISLLFFKSISVRAKEISPNIPPTCLPYFYPAAPEPTVPFIENEIVNLAKRAIDFIRDLEKNMELTGIPNYKSKVQNCFRSVFNLVWTIFMQNQNPFIFNFILQKSKIPEFKISLDHLSKQIKHYASKIGPEQDWQEPVQEGLQQKQQDAIKKAKINLKRNLIKQKINKSKDFFLQQDNKNKIEIEDKEMCCLCKQAKQDEENCYITMLSQTNWNNWLGLSPVNVLYTFNSCGHEVHRSCYNKILKKNQIYSYCPLCKAPMNIILPLPHSSTHPVEAHAFWQQFLRISRNLELDVQMEDAGRIVFQSLLAFAVIKGLLFQEYFKKQVKAYRSLVGLMRYFDKVEGKEKLLNKLNKPNIPAIGADSKVSIQAFGSFAKQLYRQIFKQSPFSEQNISPDLLASAKRVVQSLCEPESEMKEEGGALGAEVAELRAMLVEPVIQQKLGDLSNKYLGKCPNCGLVTNQQAICLICPSFQTCIKCENIGLMAHSLAQHRGSCVFLRTHTGEVIYIYRNRCWHLQSVFEDYMGRPFRTNSVGKEDFTLNPRKLQPIKEDIINNAIQSRLRYNEKIFNKVNHDLVL